MSAPSPHRLALEQGRVDAEAGLLALFRSCELRLEVVEPYAEGQARGIGAFVAAYVSPQAARNCLLAAAHAVRVPSIPADAMVDPTTVAQAAELLFETFGYSKEEVAALLRRDVREIDRMLLGRVRAKAQAS